MVNMANGSCSGRSCNEDVLNDELEEFIKMKKSFKELSSVFLILYNTCASSMSKQRIVKGMDQ
jgi:hypothetical protein